MSVFVALFDSNKNFISKRRFKLPEIIENCDTEICFNFPPHVEFESLAPFTMEIYLSVPLFIQTQMPAVKSPRQNILLKSIQIGKLTNKCGCHVLNQSDIFTLHVCTRQCLIGLWRNSCIPAFVLYTYLVSDIIVCLSRLLCPM